MAIDYSVFAIPKGPFRAETKRAKRLTKAQEERVCRAAVKRRDHGRCVVPGCRSVSHHLHHIVFRSKGGKWKSENICSLCASHHFMVHSGKITITGNADQEVIITGDRKALAFKL